MIKEEDILRFKKEKVKLDYIRRERINEILLVHPQKRTKDEDFELAELLIDYSCFQYIAEEDFNQLIALTREIYMECLLPDTVIFKQDDNPDCAYLMIQGHASVHVTFKYTKFQKTKIKTVPIFHSLNRFRNICAIWAIGHYSESFLCCFKAKEQQL